MRRDGAAASDCNLAALPDTTPFMKIRTRKLIGSIGLMAFVLAYMALAMEVTTVLLSGANGLVQAIGFATAGLLWIIPAGAIISWMAKSGSANG